MNLTRKRLPISMLSFKLEEGKEILLAEDVVSSQSEIENFKTKYKGNIIKTRKINVIQTNINGKAIYKKKRYLTGIIMFIIILAIIPVALYKFLKPGSYIIQCR